MATRRAAASPLASARRMASWAQPSATDARPDMPHRRAPSPSSLAASAWSSGLASGWSKTRARAISIAATIRSSLSWDMTRTAQYGSRAVAMPTAVHGSASRPHSRAVARLSSSASRRSSQSTIPGPRIGSTDSVARVA